MIECDDKVAFQRALKSAGGKLVVVDFWATWCGPCTAIAPLYKQLSEKYKATCVFLKVDVDKNQEVAKESGVKAMPSFGFFVNGQMLELLQGGQGLEEKIKALSAQHSKSAFSSPGHSMVGSSAGTAAGGGGGSSGGGGGGGPPRRNPWADPTFKPKTGGSFTVLEQIEREKKAQAAEKKAPSSSSAPSLSASSASSKQSSSSATSSSQASTSTHAPASRPAPVTSSAPRPRATSSSTTAPATAAPQSATPNLLTPTAVTALLLSALQMAASGGTTTSATTTTAQESKQPLETIVHAQAPVSGTHTMQEQTPAQQPTTTTEPPTTTVASVGGESTTTAAQETTTTASGATSAQVAQTPATSSPPLTVTPPTPSPAITTSSPEAPPPQDGKAGRSLPADEVDPVLLQQLMAMGFPEIRATRALIGSNNRSLDGALTWVGQHENDPDIDQPLPAKPAGEFQSYSPHQSYAPSALREDPEHPVVMDDDAELDPEMAAIVDRQKRARHTPSGGGDFQDAAEQKKVSEMTSEEKQAWLAARKREVAERKAAEEIEKEKASHRSRIEMGKAQTNAKEAAEQRALAVAEAAAAKKKREELASKAHRKEILAKINQEKERRRKEQERVLADIAAAKAAKEAAQKK